MSSSKTYYFGQQAMEVPSRYSVNKIIGRGAYGLVCSAVDTETGDKVAIKKIPRVFDDLVDAKRILRELKLLAFIRHPNLLYLKAVFRPADPESFTDVYLVTELMETDLNAVLKSRSIKLVEEHCQYFIYQLVAGLHYLHSAGVLHRDLKPANLLTNSECELKICDFGLARARGPRMTDYVVTRWYRPPELLLVCDGYTSAIDMWAVGCLAFEVITNRALFPGKDYIHQLTLITDVLGTPTLSDLRNVKSPEAKRFIQSLTPRAPTNWSHMLPNASPDLQDFVSRLLTYDPDLRLTAAEAMRHPWFKQYAVSDDTDLLEAPAAFTYDIDSDASVPSEQALRREFWDEITTWCDKNRP